MSSVLNVFHAIQSTVDAWDSGSSEEYRYYPYPTYLNSFGQRPPIYSPSRIRGSGTGGRLGFPGPTARSPSLAVDFGLFDKPCHCIKLSQCSQFIEILSQTSVASISSNLAQRFRQASCGFQNSEPIVCCPMRSSPFESKRFGSGYGSKREYFPVTTEESSWVWDVEKSKPSTAARNSGGPGKKPIHPDSSEYDFPIHSRYPNFGQRYHPGHNHLTPGWGHKKGNNFFAHFEDPRSNKNCPPSFSVEFDLPNSIEPQPPKIVNDIVLPPSPRYTPTTTTSTTQMPPPATMTPDATEPTVVVTEPVPIAPTLSTNAMIEVESRRTEKLKLINSDLCGISINTRIIGGEDAGINQFPWMARLAYRNKSK